MDSFEWQDILIDRCADQKWHNIGEFDKRNRKQSEVEKYIKCMA